MDEHLVKACERFLMLLPENDIDTMKLAYALNQFEMNANQVSIATEKLPIYHDLEYKGIRMLICEYIKQFCEIFTKGDGRLRCEVSVPSPLFLIMVYQNAGIGKWRFSTDALIAQIVLRSIFLYDRPFFETDLHMRFCGLNRMRLELMNHFACLMQFGILCDECIKCSEANSKKNINVCYPKGSEAMQRKMLAEITAEFISECEENLGLSIEPTDKKSAMKQYGRLLHIQNVLVNLHDRIDRAPLKGNSFALAQTVQLTVFDNWNRPLEALEILAKELKSAPVSENIKRMYCFYTPFLQPQIDELFRRNGVQLMGSAVFLYHGSRLSFSLKEMVADWLFGMNVRENAVTEAEYIANEIKRNGCCAYLTGMYSLDRWMGPAAMIHSRVLEERDSIPTFFLDVDFWEGGKNLTERIETICSVLNQKY